MADLSAAAVLRRHSIRIFGFTGELEGAAVGLSGVLRATDPFGMAVQYHLDWHPAGQPAWVIDGNARGDLNALNIVARTASPFRADVTGQLLELTNHFHWAGDAVLQAFDLTAWGVSSPLGSITGHIAASGDLNTFTGHGPVNPTGLQAGEFEAEFDGGYADHVLTARHMEARHLESGARAIAAGTIAIVDNGPRLDLRGPWAAFPLAPGRARPAGAQCRRHLQLQGVLPYRVHVTGDLSAATLAAMPVDVYGTLGKDRFSFDRAELDLYGGHVSANGEVVWAVPAAGTSPDAPPASTPGCCAPTCPAA